MLFIITFPKQCLVPGCQSNPQRITLSRAYSVTEQDTEEISEVQDVTAKYDGLVELQEVNDTRDHPV